MDGELNCKACRKRVYVKEMKFSKDGSGLICAECHGKEKYGINTQIKPQPPKPVENKKKIAYYCRECSFRFARAIDFRGPKTCPNCSGERIIANLPSQADDLLRELDRLDEV